MRIGMVCPYSFDVPGGVQSHVLQLAEVMRERGHDVSVLAPSSPHVELPDYVVSGGKAVPIPYNGSVARLRFGLATHRKVKRWLTEGDFDVLLHEPNAPSLSMLALQAARPIVATFHIDHKIVHAQRLSGHLAAIPREDRRPHRGVRSGQALADGGARLGCRPDPQRCRRRVVRVGATLEGYPSRQVRAVPRPVRRAAQGHGRADWSTAALVERFPDIEILIVGRGDEDELREEAGSLAGHLRSSARSTTRRRRPRCAAPTSTARRTPAASFGIVLVEAMAAGTAVVAATSTRSVGCWRTGRPDGWCRWTTPTGSRGPDRGARERRDAGRYIEAATEAVHQYDWSVVRSDHAGVRDRCRGGGEGAGGELMTWLVVTVLLVLLLVVLLLLGSWAYQTAHRLDRLHVRYDLSWQALDGCAGPARRGRPRGRRRRVWRGPGGRRLKRSPTPPSRPRRRREAAENELSAALALVDPVSLPVALVAELADAEARVTAGPPFTTTPCATRSRAARAACGAPAAAERQLPTYFEIAEQADRDVGVVSRRVGPGGAAGRGRGGAAVLLVLTPRWTARRPARVGGSPSGGAAQPRR